MNTPANTTRSSSQKTLNLTLTALFTVIIAICSWISIPAPVPFTMQTFAIFLTIGVLGGKRGTIAILVYLLLGMAGLPVFSGFRGGIGVLLNTTGGYLMGFLFSALLMWAAELLPWKGTWLQILSMILGLLLCYAFGSSWFMMVYAKTSGVIGLSTVLSLCVFPFILPDLLKIGLALVLSKRLKRALPSGF